MRITEIDRDRDRAGMSERQPSPDASARSGDDDRLDLVHAEGPLPRRTPAGDAGQEWARRLA